MKDFVAVIYKFKEGMDGNMIDGVEKVYMVEGDNVKELKEKIKNLKDNKVEISMDLSYGIIDEAKNYVSVYLYNNGEIDCESYFILESDYDEFKDVCNIINDESERFVVGF